MILNNEGSWNGQDDQLREEDAIKSGTIEASFDKDIYNENQLKEEDAFKGSLASGIYAEPDQEIDNEDDADDTTTDDFLNDDNLEPEYDKYIGDDIEFDKHGVEDETADEDKDFEAKFQANADPAPDETPEKKESDNEDLGYPDETEFEEPKKDSDVSYSEQTDVTPPKTHEFPSEGPAETDFASRAQGRTTGRMIGHEPGTEGI